MGVSVLSLLPAPPQTTPGGPASSRPSPLAAECNGTVFPLSLAEASASIDECVDAAVQYLKGRARKEGEVIQLLAEAGEQEKAVGDRIAARDKQSVQQAAAVARAMKAQVCGWGEYLRVSVCASGCVSVACVCQRVRVCPVCLLCVVCAYLFFTSCHPCLCPLTS